VNVNQSRAAPLAHASAEPTMIGTAAIVSVRGRMPMNQMFGGLAAVLVPWVDCGRIDMSVADQNA
jgi:hypothetical protein